MDKREYQEKLQEINRLIADEDYEGAARVADSIDWKRVRNVQTLVMISEVYEALERYEDSKVLLLRAYRRSPVGRTVLYRLVECCIKLRQFDQAIEYYSEYVQAAPHDNNKYILKYKIYRGRGASLEEQIDILKEYLDQEYNEKWAYELARLQIQAGQTQEGLATCDDLVLWFHSGKYVIRALELKKKYAPLTPKQQEIYDNRFEDEEEPEVHPESYLSEAAAMGKSELADAAQEEIKSELAMDISHTAQVEATKVELSRKAEEAQAEIDRKAAQSREALSAKKPSEDGDAMSAAVTGAAGGAAAAFAFGAANAPAQESEATAPVQESEAVSALEQASEAVSAPENETAGASASDEADIPAFETANIPPAAFETAGASSFETGNVPPAASETAGASSFETGNVPSTVSETAGAPAFETANIPSAASEAAGASSFETGNVPPAASETAGAPAFETAAIPFAASAAAAGIVSGMASDTDTHEPEVTAESLKAAYEDTDDGFEAENDLRVESGSGSAGTMSGESAEPSNDTEPESRFGESAASSEESVKMPEESAGQYIEAEESSVESASQYAEAEGSSIESASQYAETEGSSVESAGQFAKSEASSDEPAGMEVSSSESAGPEASSGERSASSDELADSGQSEAEPEVQEAELEVQESEPASPEQLQEEMARNMREIVSGVGPKDSLGADEAVLEEAIDQSKEDQENAVAARGTDMTFRVPVSEASQKRQAGRLTIDDILLSMGDGGDHIRRVTGGNVMSATEEAQRAEQSQAQAGAVSYDGSMMEQGAAGLGDRAGAQNALDEDAGIPRFQREEVRGAKQTAEIPAVEIAEADDALRAEMGLAGRDEAAGKAGSYASSGAPGQTVDGASSATAYSAASQAQDPTAAAVAAAFMSTPRVEYTKEIAEAKTRRLPVEEIRKLHEAYLSENASAAEEAAKNASQAAEKAAEMAQAEMEGAGTFDGDVRIAGAPGTDSGAAPYGTASSGMAPADAAPYGTIPSGRAPEEAAPYGNEPAETAPADDAPYGAALAGMALAGAAAYGVAQSETAQADAAQYRANPADAASYGTAPSGTAPYETEPTRSARSGAAPYGSASSGAAPYGSAPSGAASYGTAPTGPAPSGMAPSEKEPAFAGPASGVMSAEEESYARDAFARNGRIGEQVTREVPKSEPEPPVYTGSQHLKENQKDLFRGFLTIGSLPEQIAAAIWQAENRKDDRTSRSGNILILGAHGCGKTTIATGIAKAIAEDKGTHSVKMARIYAADLNRKDIAATIAKIAGGVLIVEEAGDLDDAIVDQLTTAMEFRTDGLIMILEDEQRYIHDLLMRHPRFTMKFTAQIYIPEYTSEDLVNFGQIYANGKDYVLSEGAAEACRSRIEAAKKSGETVSVTNVTELVDRAMKSANTFFRRIGSAKKRYDSEDRIILLEKDFR